MMKYEFCEMERDIEMLKENSAAHNSLRNLRSFRNSVFEATMVNSLKLL